MSLPNIITLGRLFLVPLVVYLILVHELGWAFWVFAAAGLSDAVDGIIARGFRARTALGGYLDPLADKALLVCVYLALGNGGYLPIWLVILVVFRDIMIVGGVLLLYLLKESLAMQPSFTSKINTTAQIALAAAVLAVRGLSFDGVPAVAATLADGLTWAVAATTLASGLLYLVQGCRLLSRWGATR